MTLFAFLISLASLIHLFLGLLHIPSILSPPHISPSTRPDEIMIFSEEKSSPLILINLLKSQLNFSRFFKSSDLTSSPSRLSFMMGRHSLVLIG